jgi:two-component system, sensor histidine kinase and response regulator
MTLSTESLFDSKILIVDDKESNTDLLKDLLEATGYVHIEVTNNPCEVVHLYPTFGPDIILLDLMMPVMDGFDVLKALNQIIPTGTYFPVLILTADISPESKKRALSEGAKDFISKPFDLNEVTLRINNLLQTRNLYLQLEGQNANLTEKVRERTHELELAYEKIKRANQDLELLEKAKLDFLNIISHEIRTPLNGILGFTGILKNSIDSPMLLDYLKYLEASAQRLEHFSYQALLITQLRTGKYPINLEAINIRQVYEQTISKLAAKISSKNLRILFEHDDDGFNLIADKELMQVCFDSLTDNAIKYSPDNQLVVVKTHIHDSELVLDFMDKGVGFSQTAKDNLFQVFGVGEKHIDKNTGLNLATIKLIMDTHKASIEILDNQPCGSIIRLIFPI